MIAYPLERPPAMISVNENGASEAAKELRERLSTVLEHYSSPRLDLLVPEIMSLVVTDPLSEDREQESVSRETANQARRFAVLLPKSLPIPEISADPDGEISFDWVSNTGKMFSVSIDETGRIAYAGRFGERSKIHGVEQLSDPLPQEVLRGIERAAE